MNLKCIRSAFPLVAGVAFFAVVSSASTTMLAGCDMKPVAARKTRGEPTGVYTTRGKVVEVPAQGKPTSEFRIHHEPIDDFKDDNGAIIGMGSMEMPFPLSAGVSLEGIAAGDIVEFTFAAWMKPGERGWEVRSIKKLPKETELRFGTAKPQ